MKEYKEWFKKAEEDFDVAEYNIEGEKFEAGAFFLQQSVEKALKALYIKKFKELLRVHDLVVLSRKLNAPENIIKNCTRLTTLYQETRYPDSGRKEDLKEEINDLVNSAKEVLEWTKKESIRIVKEFVDKLKKDYDVRKVVFFGSRAVGNYKKDSDIDLIIVSDDFEGVNRIERGARMYNYWGQQVPVDFLCYTVREFIVLKKKISIVKEALASGIVVE